MTTLIWEGDLFHDVKLMSPGKFWIGASIPLDMFSDFWEIVVEPDEELKKKTKKRDAMKQQGILKVISEDKEYFYEDEGHGRTLDLYPRIGRYYIEPYDEEIDSLDFSILHGYLLGHCHFKLEIDGEFEREKLTLTVPINQQSKLRPISSINQINKCISILKTKPKIKRTMWSRRAQEYDQKINSGKIYELAEVVKDLNKNTDIIADQSYSERQLFEKAYDRLKSEFEAVLKITSEEVQKKMDKALGRVSLSEQAE